MDYIEYKDFTIYQSQEQIYFEHIEYGEDDACCVYLDGAGNIYDYDMCYGIPDQVGEWLQLNDYNVARDTDGLWDLEDV